MRKVPIISMIFLLLHAALSAQVTITPAQESLFKKRAKEWVDTYASNLNNIGSTQLSIMDRNALIDDMLKQFEDENVIVKNDLDLSGKTPNQFKIRPHLSNIVLWFPRDGVTFNFTKVVISDVFINKSDNSFFLKAEVTRDIEGLNSRDQQVKNSYNLDLYIKYPMINGQISSKPLFYSISERNENMNSFTKVAIADKSTDNLKISEDRKDMDAIINAAKAKQEEIRRKIDAAQALKQDAIRRKEESQKQQQSMEKWQNTGLPGLSVYLSNIYNGEIAVSINKGVPVGKLFFFWKNFPFYFSARAEGGVYYKVPSKKLQGYDKVEDPIYYSTERLTAGSGLSGKFGFSGRFSKLPVSFVYTWFRDALSWDPGNFTASPANYFVSRESRGWELSAEVDFYMIRPIANLLSKNRVLNYTFGNLDFIVGYNKTTYLKYTGINYPSANPVPEISKDGSAGLSHWFFRIRYYLPVSAN